MQQYSDFTLRILVTPLALLALLCWTASCASKATAPIADVGAPESMYSADIYAVRPFLTGAGYELFSMRDSDLFVECGTIAGLNPKHHKMSGIGDRNLIAQERQRILLEDWQLEEINPLITSLIGTKVPKNELPAPGTIGTLDGSGAFEIRLRRGLTSQSYITSFNALAQEDDVPLPSLRKFFTQLRLNASPLCGRVTFGGLR
jgi:hypothetical protein